MALDRWSGAFGQMTGTRGLLGLEGFSKSPVTQICPTSQPTFHPMNEDVSPIKNGDLETHDLEAI